MLPLLDPLDNFTYKTAYKAAPIEAVAGEPPWTKAPTLLAAHGPKFGGAQKPTRTVIYTQIAPNFANANDHGRPGVGMPPIGIAWIGSLHQNQRAPRALFVSPEAASKIWRAKQNAHHHAEKLKATDAVAGSMLAVAKLGV